jgi:hypothetical protein
VTAALASRPSSSGGHAARCDPPRIAAERPHR